MDDENLYRINEGEVYEDIFHLMGQSPIFCRFIIEKALKNIDSVNIDNFISIKGLPYS